jgi:competence protein ComEC
MVFAGYLISQSRYDLARSAHFSHHTGETALLRVQLTEPPTEKVNSVQIFGKVTHVVTDTLITQCRGKLMIWLQKDSTALSLNYGDIILIENTVHRVQPPKNPNSFDYRKYLEGQNIFHQTYRRSGEWFFSGKNEGNAILAAAHHIRKQVLATLEKNNISGREFAVASALLLGYKEYLDENLQREFAGAGAMHILCVSGLHVGIIFLALNAMLAFLNRRKYGLFVKMLIIILLIWLYAAITGFSPSVRRASAMFTFLAVAVAFRRNTNIFNTIAASAFFLMLTDPFIITRLGFQLSYAAVTGIVWLQPHFRKLYSFNNHLLQYGWEVMTVSVAAQLATLPITIYYFNQFPNYFLITNLIVIPLTGVIIKAGIIFFMTSFLPVVPLYGGWILSKIVLLMNSSVAFIEGLPGSTFEHISINFHDVFFILSATVLLGFFLDSRRKVAFYSGSLCLAFLAASISFQKEKNSETRQLIVYHTPYITAIDIIKEGKLFLYASQEIVLFPAITKFNIYENRLNQGLGGTKPFHINLFENPFPDEVYASDGFINMAGHTVKVIAKQDKLSIENPFPGSVNHVILSDNVRLRIAEIIQVYNPQQIIFDSSNSMSQSARWLSQCDSLGTKCWSVPHSGAFVYNF